MEGKSLLILTSFCIGECTHGNTEKFYMKATPQNCESVTLGVYRIYSNLLHFILSELFIKAADKITIKNF
jgi:hypothetical protein